VRRGIQKARHRPGNTRLVSLAGTQQREPFESSKLAWSDFDRHQHAPVSASVSVGFTAFPSVLSALITGGRAHAATKFPKFCRC
jgi:hypothetical protein